MSAAQPTFRGRFAHTIDGKGRTSIPSGFRSELQRRSDGPPILTNLLDCLALFPAERWVEIEQRLSEASQMQPDVQAFQRFLVSGAVECAIDAQGRILVPPYLREHARLSREIIIAGVGPRIEIWDRARFEEDLARTQARFREISSTVAALGM